MKKYILSHQEEFLLLLIMLVGAFLRFYNSANLSLTGDELASLAMLQDSTFAELIQNGVRKDFHPALFQVLLFYWVDWFGIDEGIIRIPFVLAGILSILFAYLIASTWFNKTSGLFVAASIAFLLFPLVHSQIARPYSLGLLFSLMSVWFWTLVLFRSRPYQAWKILGYCVSTALSMYTHYFSFFLVLVVAVTGLFYLSKENYKRIIGCAILTVVLFLPHFDISLGHLTIGGFEEGGWLGPPNLGGSWFWRHVLYCFNGSLLVLAVYFGVFAYLARRNYKKVGFNKFHGFALLWFLTPYFVGYYYSIFALPVLQNSVLLFSFPFLIILVFSFVEDRPWNKLKTATLVVFLGMGVLSTVVAEKFYVRGHFGVLKELVQEVIGYSDKYGDENITNTTNVGLTYFVEHYMNKYDRQIEFKEYKNGAPPEEKYVNRGGEQLGLLQGILDASETPFFSYSWSSKYSPEEIPEIIMEKYPYLVDRKYFFNSEVYLFTDDSTKGHLEAPVYLELCDYEQGIKPWQGIEDGINGMEFRSGSKSYKMQAEDEFSPVFKGRVSDLMTNSENVIHLSLWVKMAAKSNDVIMVIELQTPDGEGYVWNGMNISHFYDKPNTWFKAFHSKRFYRIRSPEDLVKIYIWNNEGVEFSMDDIQIKVTEGNPIIFGKRDISL